MIPFFGYMLNLLAGLIHINLITSLRVIFFFDTASNINGNINSAPGEPGGAIKKFFFPFNFSL